MIQMQQLVLNVHFPNQDMTVMVIVITIQMAMVFVMNLKLRAVKMGKHVIIMRMQLIQLNVHFLMKII